MAQNLYAFEENNESTIIKPKKKQKVAKNKKLFSK